MKVKVCGMRDKANIQQLGDLQPDYMGFIFYDKSPRYVDEDLDDELIKSLPKEIKKVGVFVNANPGYILDTVKKYDLQFVQLHGNEMPDFCRSLRQKGLSIIKAFPVTEDFNFAMLNNYKPHCDFFLFDAQGENPGGNGTSFNWDVLKRYNNEKPFFLSGGIGLDNLDEVITLSKSIRIYGIDINSKFETSPALKNIDKIKEAIEKVRVKKNIEA